MNVQPRPEVLRHTARVVSAHLGHNQVAAEALPQLIQSVYGALAGLSAGPQPAADVPRTPAVPICRSVSPDHIVCLEDGAKMKMLKRYIMTRFGLTPAAYRERWGLPADYPMVAPAYASTRSALAKQIGLGRKRTPNQSETDTDEPQADADGAVTITKVPARRARGSKG